ncbi:glutathione peroxidase [Alkalilimnicola ehrlichii]|uniref:Glutathione peroxidase n=1 Tax=Alkalilimnicola ehrlichii TaxID=351052 RepID=A0A3E0WL51_9GAMM|nr:glutathione peroxidase [Alkalilimnicola ehrlichii]RFA25579.1 glutathione peroxidase [Alkalilimnicola ehrlichii]RFA32706.1 glutathione peroxidase [Alkalilimnicola ehrlichii]
MRGILLIVLLFAWTAAQAETCPEILQHEMRALNTDEVVDLCERYQGKPLLIVNTASRCGFTSQFEDLEALHRQYADKGLAVLGFPSNDFRQEASEEGVTAEVCYINYGVTFDMYAPISVRGKSAHPLFASLASEQRAPAWNFFKYLVSREGEVVAAFSSRTKPSDPRLIEVLESLL